MGHGGPGYTPIILDLRDQAVQDGVQYKQHEEKQEEIWPNLFHRPHHLLEYLGSLARRFRARLSSLRG